MRHVAVYYNETKAGILIEENPGRGYIFRYDEDYLASPLPAVSLTMPKRKDDYTSEHIFPFFSNMLPEGSNRRIICRSLRIDEEDLFSLLVAMADHDFIGAVNIRSLHHD